MKNIRKKKTNTEDYLKFVHQLSGRIDSQDTKPIGKEPSKEIPTEPSEQLIEEIKKNKIRKFPNSSYSTTHLLTYPSGLDCNTKNIQVLYNHNNLENILFS